MQYFASAAEVLSYFISSRGEVVFRNWAEEALFLKFMGEFIGTFDAYSWAARKEGMCQQYTIAALQGMMCRQNDS